MHFKSILNNYQHIFCSLNAFLPLQDQISYLLLNETRQKRQIGELHLKKRGDLELQILAWYLCPVIRKLSLIPLFSYSLLFPLPHPLKFQSLGLSILSTDMKMELKFSSRRKTVMTSIQYEILYNFYCP